LPKAADRLFRDLGVLRKLTALNSGLAATTVRSHIFPIQLKPLWLRTVVAANFEVPFAVVSPPGRAGFEDLSNSP